MESSFRLKAVIAFADQVLETGRDCYGSIRKRRNTPLFADGIYLDNYQHLLWGPSDTPTAYVSSNLVNQQNLFRTLVGLSKVAKKSQYEQAVVDCLTYHFDVLQDAGGLLAMGGHRGIDLASLEIIGNSGKVHELKDSLLFYEAMFNVNPKATSKYIKAFWARHVMDWQNLEITRHGSYGKPIPEKLWQESFNDPEPFRKTHGLSFVNAGNDLIYAAANLYKHTQDEGAWLWCGRLAKMYYKSRHPETNLGAYQFTQPLKRAEPTPGDPFYSHFGDRAQRQFGPELGADALEGYMLLRSHAISIYVKHGLMQLDIAQMLGDAGKIFLDNVLSGMLAYQKWAYIPETNLLRPLLANGTDLSDFVVPRHGYYGERGRIFRQLPAEPCFFLAWSRAFNITGETQLWEMITNMAKAYGLGNWGDNPDQPNQINMDTSLADSQVIFGLLDIWQKTGKQDYLALAEVIGNNLVQTQNPDGFFTNQDMNHLLFDDIRPLALLTLEAAVEDQYDQVPRYLGGTGSGHWGRHYRF